MPRTTPLVLPGLCLALCALEVLGVLAGTGFRAPLADVVQRALPAWLLLALLAPLLHAGVVRSRLATSVLLTVAVASTWMTLSSAFAAATTGASFLPHLIATAGRYFAHALATVALLFGVAHALRYHAEWRERERAAAALHAELERARTDALRGRLEPHFLFNTLNAIGGLALRGERDAVRDTLGALGDMLRVALVQEPEREVPLREELELLRRYLEIQRVRFRDRLAVEWDVAENALEQRLPVLTLQPLVENAIGHGIARSASGGTVRITAHVLAGTLLVSVEDRTGARSAAPTRGWGIGLSVTRARLHDLYGDAAAVELHAGDTGTRAEVRVPRAALVRA